MNQDCKNGWKSGKPEERHGHTHKNGMILSKNIEGKKILEIKTELGERSLKWRK